MNKCLDFKIFYSSLKHETQVELHKFEHHCAKANTEEQHPLLWPYEIDNDSCYEANHKCPVQQSANRVDAIA